MRPIVGLVECGRLGATAVALGRSSRSSQMGIWICRATRSSFTRACVLCERAHRVSHARTARRFSVNGRPLGDAFVEPRRRLLVARRNSRVPFGPLAPRACSAVAIRRRDAPSVGCAPLEAIRALDERDLVRRRRKSEERGRRDGAARRGSSKGAWSRNQPCQPDERSSYGGTMDRGEGGPQDRATPRTFVPVTRRSSRSRLESPLRLRGRYSVPSSRSLHAKSRILARKA